ncbi:dodecin family protein [Candidatus Bathyarchaeota archaeon]|nr:dodecin family protein [Candidatus Bathyarchaeota archaeon]
MSVAKVIELIGSSKVSFDDATKNALKEGVKTIREIKEIWVQNFSALVEDGKITEYRANVKLTFLVEPNRLKK